MHYQTLSKLSVLQTSLTKIPAEDDTQTTEPNVHMGGDLTKSFVNESQSHTANNWFSINHHVTDMFPVVL